MIHIEIGVTDYLKCCDYSENNWSKSKPGRYGKGIGNNANDPNRIERVSKISELAVSQLFGVEEPDYEYRKGGDGGSDLEICGLSVDIKCAMRPGTRNYFKGIDKIGRSTVKADLYIFAYLEGENRLAHKAAIVVVGYLTKQQVMDQELKVPSKGWSKQKCNYEIEHSVMLPIEDLIKELGIDYEETT
jgi:hypothetical protein